MAKVTEPAAVHLARCPSDKVFPPSRSTRKLQNSLDLDIRAQRQGNHLDGRAGRRGGREKLAVGAVDGLEVGEIGEEDGSLGDPRQLPTGGPGDGLDVAQHLPGPVGDRGFDQLAGGRIDRQLAGDEDQTATGDGLGIRADGGGGMAGGDRSFHSGVPWVKGVAVAVDCFGYFPAAAANLAPRFSRSVIACPSGLPLIDEGSTILLSLKDLAIDSML